MLEKCSRGYLWSDIRAPGAKFDPHSTQLGPILTNSGPSQANFGGAKIGPTLANSVQTWVNLVVRRPARFRPCPVRQGSISRAVVRALLRDPRRAARQQFFSMFGSMFERVQVEGGVGRHPGDRSRGVGQLKGARYLHKVYRCIFRMQRSSMGRHTKRVLIASLVYFLAQITFCAHSLAACRHRHLGARSCLCVRIFRGAVCCFKQLLASLARMEARRRRRS